MEFQPRSYSYRDGNAIYQQSSPEEGGKTAKVKIGNENVTITNQWVVMYNAGSQGKKLEVYSQLHFFHSGRLGRDSHVQIYQPHSSPPIVHTSNRSPPSWTRQLQTYPARLL